MEQLFVLVADPDGKPPYLVGLNISKSQVQGRLLAAFQQMGFEVNYSADRDFQSVLSEYRVENWSGGPDVIRVLGVGSITVVSQ